MAPSPETQPGWARAPKSLSGVPHPQALWITIWKGPRPGTLQTWSSSALPPTALDSVQTTDFPAPQFSHLEHKAKRL